MNEFKPQLHYCILFWTNTLGEGMNYLISPAMSKIVPQLFFIYKDDFGIK